MNKIRKFKYRQGTGFTIVEVLIVLAIAALILAIVLYAVPKLQSSQRNTSRRHEAATVASSIIEWESNTGQATGSIPKTVGDCNSVMGSAGALPQYNFGASPCLAGPLGTLTNGKVYIVDGSGGLSIPNLAAAKNKNMVIAYDAKCGGTNVATATTGDVALFYSLEGGVDAWACITPQQ
ncbi:MAG TPA: prepilin-type N-terminal cleavage/methylation domain-containing protein [Candidatus Saccharimonadales bacterium]|nr:prepilin-type N-terminal cleavage/methylation domain-containing protein [Candidatus Saccharimonadales bacterium]